jgi:hypothetical protein
MAVDLSTLGEVAANDLPSSCLILMAHIDEDCSHLSGHFQKEVFYNCTFKKLNGLVLERCPLNHSRFITEDLKDALDFTMTLGCLSFENVELSPLLFDLLICLMLKTKGNDSKRRALIDVVGKKRVHELLVAMKDLE